LFIFLIAQGCELKYVEYITPIATGSKTSVRVELACTSNTGAKQTVAEYQAVECPRNNEDEDEG
jgi:hypothetical protein